MEYRLGMPSDLDNICYLIGDAIVEMEEHGIYQWDEIYPNRNDFENDIRNNTLCLINIFSFSGIDGGALSRNRICRGIKKNMIKYGEFITPEEYMELRKMVGWVEFPIEQARACIEKAYMIQCVRDDEKAIGVVRLLWDGGYIAFLSDVIVDPKYQGQGIGRKLVEASISKLKDGMKPGYKVKLTLNSAKGKESFYEKFGFRVRPNDDAGPGMDQWLIMDEA